MTWWILIARWCQAGLATVLLAVATLCASAVTPRRVLLLHSYGQGFEPFSSFSEAFRTALGQQLGDPAEFHDVALESARFEGETSQGPLADYLAALFSSRRLDLIVTVGGPAAHFGQKYRARLFPSTPMLIASVDQRQLQTVALTTNDAVVAVANDPGRVLRSILQVLPTTTNVVVVIGNSPLERFWLGEMRGQFQPFTNRLSVAWFNDLSFAEMEKRAATLPPQSVIYYAFLSVDAEGVPYVGERALRRLHEVANAPIFGLYDIQMGRGIVGGPLLSVEDLSRSTAKVAVRILRGELAGSLKTSVQAPGRPVYDWRELRRWGINETRLPADSVIRFRQPTLWELHKWRIITITSLCIFEALLIFLLLANLAKRRRAERSSHELSGRLIRAQEDERARLARELHDDVTQRLALLAIDTGRVERESSAPPLTQAMAKLRGGLVRLSEDIHTLSYRLHPGVLEDLGLTEALKAEGERFARNEPISLEVKCHDVPDSVPPDTALCLFRVAQEALRNITRHARARAVRVSLRGLDHGLQLAVQDDGCGFEPGLTRDRPSLGLASMRERVHLLGGELDIESEPGHGTTVLAWVPLEKAKG